MRALSVERWKQVSPYLDQALTLPVEHRAAWLESVRADNSEIGDILGELLAGHGALVEERFLEGSVLHPLSEASFPGQTVGSYRLISPIGQGGMGAVWLAERNDGRFERRVAMKFLHFSVSVKSGRERFEREGKILGQLRHPHIAELIDAGVDDHNRPYLVLEHVQGQAIDRHCDERKLDVQERIRLFVDVLTAVAHAHAHLVVHRDIKPSNVMVGADGAVKLLDFGIAKLLADEAATPAATLLTLENGSALTPQFAAPEQINGATITTATDVYSLGVLLYLLLTGRHPVPADAGSPAELVKAILDIEPPLGSEAVLAADPMAAVKRSTSTDKLHRQLRGDLDTIVAKALKKSPAERYTSVGALADDLRRYQRQEPIQARPDTLAYRTAKFVHRNKLPVLGGTAILLALGAGLTAALWQANIARKEARTAAAVEQFTEDIFRMNNRANPDPENAQRTTARQLLDMGARKASSSLNDAPEAKLQMLDLLGSLYQDLELSDQAVALRRDRVAVAKKIYGPESPQVVPALTELGRSMHSSRSVNERESVLLEAKTILDRSGDFTSKDRGNVLSALAEAYTSTDLKKAPQMAKESVAILRRWPGSPDLALALRTAGFAYISSQDFAGAEAAMSEAIQLSKQLSGNPNPALIQYFATEAQAQMSQSKYGAAERSYREAFADAKAIGGDNGIDTFMTEGRLGILLVLTSRSGEALPYLERGLTACLQVKGADDPFFTPQLQMEYGDGLEAAGRLEDALAQISAAVKNRREHRPGTAYLARMLEDEAEVLVELGRFAEAEQALQESEGISNKVHARLADDYLRPRVRLSLEQGHYREAEALLDKYASPITANAPVSVGLIRNYYVRSEIALQGGDFAVAKSLARDLRKRLADTHMEFYLNTWRVRALTWEARADLLQGKAQEALPLLEEAVENERRAFDAKSPELGTTEALLGRAYLEAGNRSRAALLLASASLRLDTHRELCPSYRRDRSELQRRLERGPVIR